eukprot:5706145-Alexandrium_andersonii.AAC.1
MPTRWATTSRAARAGPAGRGRPAQEEGAGRERPSSRNPLYARPPHSGPTTPGSSLDRRGSSPPHRF